MNEGYAFMFNMLYVWIKALAYYITDGFDEISGHLDDEGIGAPGFESILPFIIWCRNMFGPYVYIYSSYYGKALWD